MAAGQDFTSWAAWHDASRLCLEQALEKTLGPPGSGESWLVRSSARFFSSFLAVAQPWGCSQPTQDGRPLPSLSCPAGLRTSHSRLAARGLRIPQGSSSQQLTRSRCSPSHLLSAGSLPLAPAAQSPVPPGLYRNAVPFSLTAPQLQGVCCL